MENKIKLELLAPARNLAAGKIAVLAGADAVYIGGPKLGARAGASNSWEDIKALVDFAHQYYVRVYVALNTIFFDNEASLMKKSLEKAYEIGADAAIIQDLGVLEMDLPPLPLFASTQMNNYDFERIDFLAKAGFPRIILARELSLRQIEKIKNGLRDNGNPAELEAFVHGALCVSFSGQCYFSQALSGRSANRGCCQQVCRLPFDLLDAEGRVLAQDKYLLSLKDLNLSQRLNDLLEAGITGFKIEGRLKDDAYVGNVTAEYRRLLDGIIDASGGKYARASSGRVVLSFVPDLQKTFNRSYTEYFLDKRQGDVISPDSQKSVGRLIGTVKECTRDYFVLKEKVALKNGNGICWFVDGRLQGININRAADWRIYPARRQYIAPGTKVFCNQDQSFEKEASEGAVRKVAADFLIEEAAAGFKLTIKDEDGNEFSKTFAQEKNLAQKSGQEAFWREQFSKLGESVFSARDFHFALAEEYFVPLSLLNSWRRELAAGLAEERLKNYPRRKAEFCRTAAPFPSKKLDYSYNVTNNLSKAFYARHGAKVEEEAMEKTNDTKGKKLMTTKHCLKYWLGACPKNKSHGRKTALKEPLYLARDGKRYKLKFDCQNCQMEIYGE
jgi:putative protease